MSDVMGTNVTSPGGRIDLLAIYHGLFDTSPDPIYIEDENGLVLDANQAACRFQAMTREELIGCSVLTLVPVSERVRLERDFKRWFSGELSSYEGFTKKPDGAVVPVEVHGIRIDYQGKPAVILHVRDISLLHRKQQEFALIFEHMISGCALHEIILDADGVPVDYRFLAVNRAFERMVGKTAEETIGRTVMELLPQTEKYWVDTYARVALTGEVAHFENYSRILDKHFEVSAYSPERGKFVTVVQDVTERHKAMLNLKDQQERERQVLAAQKLESLGILAGGIAHDFNNLLVGVLGNAELALMHVGEENPANEYIEQIRIAGKRASELTQLMLAYSGRARFNHGPVALNELVGETCRLVSMAISKKISIRMNMDPSLPMISGDIAQLRQLVMNSITNAADAIGDQPGEITIATKGVLLSPSDFASVGETPPLAAGMYVVLEVADNGCGIDPSLHSRIFEPFFTSKFSGRGLGLSAVLGIIKGHHGGIELISAPGRGTRFRFAFPVTTASDVPAREDVVRETKPPSIKDAGRQVVLVVDDESVVRLVLRKVLERSGFVVAEADNGIVALEYLRAHPASVSLIMLDLTMPHWSGEETIEAISQAGFHIPILIMSGYAESESAERFTSPMVRGYIEKPFVLQDVVNKIHAAIVPAQHA
jgi:two-component system cell cycle sensor histidine kinase/response regulator CckA